MSIPPQEHEAAVNHSVAERTALLLEQMTLTEKCKQLIGIMPTEFLGSDGTDSEAMRRTLSDGIGQISNFSSVVTTPIEIARLVNGVQRFLVEHTRLGIPALFHAEAANGFVAPGYTSFPTPIALAATWNPAAVEQMAEITRDQMRRVGVRLALSPVMDIARDPRWGRVHETYGEDVYLASEFSVAFTRGLQGPDLRQGVAATGKHFLGYGLTEGGQNMAATHAGPRELYDVYAAPFEAAIRLAGLEAVMNSYAEIDGVPVSASSAILRDLLRDRIGFTGPVVSDYTTVEWLVSRQSVAGSAAEAGALAISAGIDVELPSEYGYGATLETEVRAGRVREQDVDEAVGRVLAQKFRLGLFENPYADTDPITIQESTSGGRELSDQLARESITLLKNDDVLPLSGVEKIAVIGPNSESAVANFAAYTYPRMVDMLQGLAMGTSRMAGVERMAAAADVEPDVVAATTEKFTELVQIDIDALARTHHGATDLASAIRSAFPTAQVRSAEGVGIDAGDTSSLDEAQALAVWADVVILALGGRSGWFGADITEGEGTDAARIELPPQQIELVQRLSTTGTPLIGVLYQGKAYATSAIDEQLSAAVVAFYPGPGGADAAASVISGATNPSGKLPYTIPRATGQIPIYYSQKRGSGYRRSDTDMFREYVDLENTPLYAFGHGLSFSEFDYRNFTVENDEVLTDGGVIVATVDIINTSARTGTETVQFYVSGSAVGVTRPGQQLVGFTRVALSPGQGATVRCAIPVDILGYSGVDGQFQLQPTSATVAVGSASDDLRGHHDLTITGDTVFPEGARSYLSSTTVSLHNASERNPR